MNQAGDVAIAGTLTAGGGKGGYVVDHFINAVGDALERGDVVVVGGNEVKHYYGVGNSIPVPEVDLTDRAYDTRVCGIVESVVRADQPATLRHTISLRGRSQCGAGGAQCPA